MKSNFKELQGSEFKFRHNPNPFFLKPYTSLDVLNKAGDFLTSVLPNLDTIKSFSPKVVYTLESFLNNYNCTGQSFEVYNNNIIPDTDFIVFPLSNHVLNPIPFQSNNIIPLNM